MKTTIAKAAYKLKRAIVNKANKYPKTTVAVGLTGMGYGYGKTPMARKTQNQIIEMQAIAKERKVRKISRSEIDTRLAKAKNSKRKFTWI